jgi:hypothetical protein
MKQNVYWKNMGPSHNSTRLKSLMLSPLYNMFQLAFYACWNFVKYLKMKIF